MIKKMKLRVNVLWNPEVEFENSDLVDITLSFENGEKQIFKGQIKRADSVMSYLWNLYVSATNDYLNEKDYVGEIVEKTKGKRVYEIPVSVSGKELSTLIRDAERIQIKHFIPSRGKYVSDEEYCKFFGSSGNLWDTDKCDYPVGDFDEMLRQTAYDMEHGNPGVYFWTNVPRMIMITDVLKNDGEFAKYFEIEVEPLCERAYLEERNENIEGIIREYNAIAEAVERYKEEHGLETITNRRCC